MELKLIVLAGAKVGTEIPLKKDEFVIGRAKECTLRAGSEAISRRHCAIARKGDAWTARDLKSRNGTYVNDQKIEQETTLSVGDELRVGPLTFRIESREAAVVKPPKTADISRGKQPAVKDVTDIAQRSAGKSDACPLPRLNSVDQSAACVAPSSILTLTFVLRPSSRICPVTISPGPDASNKPATLLPAPSPARTASI